MELIRTSDQDWLSRVLRNCKDKTDFRFVDDLALGFHQSDLVSGFAILSKAYNAGVDWMRIARALAGIGFTGVGVWLIRLAVIDPEPTSRLSLMIGGGLLCVLIGGAVLFEALNSPIRLKGRIYGGGIDCSFN